MAMVEKSKQQYDPSDNLDTPGTYHAICSDVKQGIENKSYPNGKPLIVIEFTVLVGQGLATGKKVAIVCGESLYRDKRSGRKSRFLTHSEEMGIADPESGYDPCCHLDRHYTITADVNDGKMFVTRAVPYVAPPAKKPGGKSSAPQAAAPDAPGVGGVPF